MRMFVCALLADSADFWCGDAILCRALVIRDYIGNASKINC